MASGGALEAPPAPGEPASAELRRLCARLGGLTIVAKGEVDQISNGGEGVVVGGSGSRRRAGGQGDVLAGACCRSPFAVSCPSDQP
jgi:NAD(P)H-hydrate repair Nnr-like enzyme with NAD(P)H-hydrate dehydratase domain